MSYTTGGQTIDKSMNGILSFNGESVAADNITCEILEVNSSATFDGTASFNNNLPTSVITSTTNGNQFITKNIGDALYAGSGILGTNNTWTGQNYYNTVLPSSTLTGTPSSNDIAPVSMLNNLYASLVSGGYARLTSVVNTFTNNNIFQGTINCTSTATLATLQTLFVSWSGLSGTIVEQTFDTATGVLKFLHYVGGTLNRYDFAFIPTTVEVVVFRIQETVSTFFTRVQVTTPDTTNTNSTALSLTNSNATPTSLNMSLSWNGGVNGIIQAGDTAIIARTVLDSATTALTLAPWSSTNCGIRITKDDVTMLGLTNNFSATTTNITGATNFTSLPSTTTTFTSATANQFITKNIGDTLYTVTGGYARLTTVANAFTNNNTFVNLPSTTTTFTTATANQFITRSIGDALYPTIPTGGYARLTTVDNTFTNNNTLGVSAGTQNTIIYGAGVYLAATENIAESTNNVALATPAFRIRGRSNDTKTIKFIPQATVGALNPVVLVNDGVISADTVLTLTADHVANAVGIRIVDDGNIFFRGTTATFGVEGGTTNTIMYGAGVYMSTTDNCAESTSNVALATPAFRIRGFRNDAKQIKFIPNATISALNPITVVNDAVISADTVLTLTAEHATNAVGIRILDTGVVNVVGTTTNLNATNLVVSASTATSFVNLPATTTTFTTATANQFITRNIGDALYTATGGFARLSSVDNAFTNNNSFNSNLPTSTITTSSSVSQFITRTIASIYYGALSTVNTWTQTQTMNAPITLGYSTIPTFTSSQIGYTFQSAVFTFNCPTASQIYQLGTISIPSAGVWRIDVYIKVLSGLQPCRYDLSISRYVAVPYFEINRVSGYINKTAGTFGAFCMHTSYTKYFTALDDWTPAFSSEIAQLSPTVESCWVYTRLA